LEEIMRHKHPKETTDDPNLADLAWQLVIEYDPQPPFEAGSPESAGRALADDVRSRRATLIEAARRLAGASGRAPGDRI
jgi:hypothetical protein